MPLLPAFSMHFGLHPPAIYELTDYELEPYLDALIDIAEANRG